MGELSFTDEEYGARLRAVRGAMAREDVALFLISTPENIYYLTGLDHWGYFAPHILLVPAAGEMVLVTRAMEKVTVANQVRNARFEGHSDHETAADAVGRVLRDAVPAKSRVAIEAWSAGLPHGLAVAIEQHLDARPRLDFTGVVDDLRLIKSPAEQACMRQAAEVSDAGASAAIEAIRHGANERDVAAACHCAMIRRGGTYPGFGPFIRSTGRLGEEHTTWTDKSLAAGDCVLLELTGCVARYHAPLGRLIHVGQAPDEALAIAATCQHAFDAVVASLRDGVEFRNVYAAWQAVVDGAGLSDYRRHHCGYVVGSGFPPSWTGGNKVTGLRHDSTRVVQAGMTFHVLSWLMGTGRGDFFLSNTALVGPHGAEILTRTPAGVTVR
jgi:Xaa-Pro dipeptidase